MKIHHTFFCRLDQTHNSSSHESKYCSSSVCDRQTLEPHVLAPLDCQSMGILAMDAKKRFNKVICRAIAFGVVGFLCANTDAADNALQRAWEVLRGNWVFQHESFEVRP